MSQNEDRITKAVSRYTIAAHSMQAGVAMEHANNGAIDATPKMLRVGVNSALVDSAGLAQLLINKGLISEVEYMEAMADAMEAEKERYEAIHKEKYGLEVTLGGLDIVG